MSVIMISNYISWWKIYTRAVCCRGKDIDTKLLLSTCCPHNISNQKTTPSAKIMPPYRCVWSARGCSQLLLKTSTSGADVLLRRDAAVPSGVFEQTTIRLRRRWWRQWRWRWRRWWWRVRVRGELGAPHRMYAHGKKENKFRDLDKIGHELWWGIHIYNYCFDILIYLYRFCVWCARTQTTDFADFWRVNIMKCQ